ncbi:hypothetical protein ABEG18_20145 [Alsobacter sp. KACC 23698]|uniref:PepSY domain-containing protein n=1 Tax=Alsobacter sp. KACC 23698 TaxID=3149229 RepID=A0AAU7JCR4_9HYPH
MHPHFAAAGRQTAVARRFVRRGALALAALVMAGASLPALAAPLGAGRLPVAPLAAPAQFSGFMMGPGEVADILYSRYGYQRVMRIRSVGDVFEADAVDRRGYRVHVTVDGYDGRLLESFAVGDRAYDAPAPIPPRSVPGYRGAPVGSAALPPLRDEEERYGARPPAARIGPDPLERSAPRPPRSREARTPDASTAPAPARKPKAVPSLPKPAEQSAPPKSETTAARPVAPEPAPQPVAPAPIPAPAPPPVTVAPAPAEAPAAAAPQEPPVRQASPAPTRIPEPLVDPKTGKPTASSDNGAVPAAPLDDSSSRGPAAASPAVPPAALD